MDNREIDLGADTDNQLKIVLAEILENTRKTRNYIKWQMIITVALVVIPILAMALIIPFALRSLTSIYSGVLQ